MKSHPRVLVLALFAGLLMPGASPRAQQVSPGTVVLKPTNHPRLPNELSQLWLAPIAPGGTNRAGVVVQTASLNEFVTGVKREVESNLA